MAKGAIKSGGKCKKPRSLVQKAAHNAPRARKRLAEKTCILDPTRTTFGRTKKSFLRKHNAAPTPSQSKRQFKKVPGTRIQLNKDGQKVRVVDGDGKEFPPDNVYGVKQYMAKLVQKKAEMEEIQRMRGELPELKPEDETVEDSIVVESKKKKKLVKSIDSKPDTKTAAKKAPENVSKDEDTRYSGKVLQASKKRAWVRHDGKVPLPEGSEDILEDMQAKRRASGDGSVPDWSSARGQIIPVKLFLKSETQLKLRAGTIVSFSLQVSGNEIVGCRIALSESHKSSQVASKRIASAAEEGNASKKTKL